MFLQILKCSYKTVIKLAQITNKGNTKLESFALFIDEQWIVRDSFCIQGVVKDRLFT